MEPGHQKKRREGSSAAGWESIYCSLVLILVALFAMLVSYSTVEGDRVTNFMRGFNTDAQTPGKSSLLEPRDMLNVGRPGGGQSRNALSLSKDETEDDSKIIMSAMETLQSHFEKMHSKDHVVVRKTEGGFSTTLNSSLLFPPGTAVVREEAYPYIDKMIAVLSNFPFSATIEGHTDDIPIHTRKFPSNWVLSTTRAINVMRLFLERGALSAERLCAVGFGSYHPLASNENPEGRRTNRRVEVFFNLEREDPPV